MLSLYIRSYVDERKVEYIDGFNQCLVAPQSDYIQARPR